MCISGENFDDIIRPTNGALDSVPVRRFEKQYEITIDTVAMIILYIL